MKNEDCRMSNFQTTEEEYRQYAKLATSAESLIYSDPKSSVAVFGNFSEQLTREIMHLEGFGDWNLKQIDRINELKYRGDYPPIVTKYLDDIVFYTDYIPDYDNNEEAQQLWEYTVIFKDNTDGYKRYDGEFIHEDKSEADNVFKLYKNDVEQYYVKEWIKYCEDEDWIENDVEVIYSDITKEDV